MSEILYALIIFAYRNKKIKLIKLIFVNSSEFKQIKIKIFDAYIQGVPKRLKRAIIL